MKKLIFFTVIVFAAFSSAATKPLKSSVPSWFAKASANPEVFVGVAPPCSDPKGSEDMAIAVAMLSWLNSTTDTKTRIVGDIDDSRNDTVMRKYICYSAEQNNDVPPIELLKLSFNDNGECFVACRLKECKEKGVITTYKETALFPDNDSVYDYSTVDLDLTVASSTSKAEKRNIAIKYLMEINKSGTKFLRLMANDMDLEADKKFSYPNKKLRKIRNAGKFPIEGNLGTSLYRLMTLLPAVSSDTIRSRSFWSVSEREGKSVSDNLFAFEILGKTFRSNISFDGISNGQLLFSMPRQRMLAELKEVYEHPNKEAIIPVSQFFDADAFGLDVGLSISFLKAVFQWHRQHPSAGKKASISDDDNKESYGEKAIAEKGINILWHIGDGVATVPSDTQLPVNADACGVTVWSK